DISQPCRHHHTARNAAGGTRRNRVDIHERLLWRRVIYAIPLLQEPRPPHRKPAKHASHHRKPPSVTGRGSSPAVLRPKAHGIGRRTWPDAAHHESGAASD